MDSRPTGDGDHDVCGPIGNADMVRVSDGFKPIGTAVMEPLDRFINEAT